MKKILLSIAAVALVAMMMTSVYAQVPAPPSTCGRCPGFTPGFWKHNIRVYLDLTKGAYSAFEGGPLDGVKLTDGMMESLLADINAESGLGLTFEQALEYLKLKGWEPDRTNTANWFNWAAGYDEF